MVHTDIMAKSLMFVGTASESGKSFLATAMCRILKRNGIRVAPFKAQNMALNSFITLDGGEMGRAQVVQAEAAGLEPQVDMNPVLLKPTSEKGSQVIVQGIVAGNMEASEYYAMKRSLWPRITESYDRLAKRFDVVVLEGAGSPVEMNLKQNDIVNMAMAEYADASVVLVADIDRGGVFASIIGTVELFEQREKERLLGFIINKFRGDASLLKEGLAFIEERTARPVFGVVPYARDLYVPGEDSVALERKSKPKGNLTHEVPSLAVIHLPHLSNYTDFDPLESDPRFKTDYIDTPKYLSRYDGVILPGSKNVFFDLSFLVDHDFKDALYQYYYRGGKIVGICGGFQMLGHIIKDPYGVESSSEYINGLELLPITTTMEKQKVTARVKTVFRLPGDDHSDEVEGYEIHMGKTTVLDEQAVLFLRTDHAQGLDGNKGDGIATLDGRIWGTYLHGLFENDRFRSIFLNWVINADRKGDLDEVSNKSFSYARFKEENFDKLADLVEHHVNVHHIFEKMNITF
jgi:adenosylcobyric acid synthase